MKKELKKKIEKHISEGKDLLYISYNEYDDFEVSKDFKYTISRIYYVIIADSRKYKNETWINLNFKDNVLKLLESEEKIVRGYTYRHGYVSSMSYKFILKLTDILEDIKQFEKYSITEQMISDALDWEPEEYQEKNKKIDFASLYYTIFGVIDRSRSQVIDGIEHIWENCQCEYCEELDLTDYH